MQRCALYIFFSSPLVPISSFGPLFSGINLSHLVPEEQQSSACGFMNHDCRSPVFKRGQYGAIGKVKIELACRTKDCYWGISENLILLPDSLTPASSPGLNLSLLKVLSNMSLPL